MPNEFVVKCAHDCGSTLIVRDKANEDIKGVKKHLSRCLCNETGYSTCEPHYHRIKPRIIAEKFFANDNKIESSSLIDYKIWCLDGEPYCAVVCYDRHREASGHIAVVVDLYSLFPWKPMRGGLSAQMKSQHFKDIPEPTNLKDMLEISKRISKGFPQVRVDLYNLNGKIYFSEMTFTSASVDHYYFSEETKLEMGKRISLPVRT